MDAPSEAVWRRTSHPEQSVVSRPAPSQTDNAECWICCIPERWNSTTSLIPCSYSKRLMMLHERTQEKENRNTKTFGTIIRSDWSCSALKSSALRELITAAPQPGGVPSTGMHQSATAVREETLESPPPASSNMYDDGQNSTDSLRLSPDRHACPVPWKVIKRIIHVQYIHDFCTFSVLQSQ